MIRAGDAREWRKASHSMSNGRCIEVAAMPHGLVAIRDSRQSDPGHPVVLVPDRVWQAFIGRVRAGEYGPGYWPAPPIQAPLSCVLANRLV